jgi:hypothetical protein
MPAMGMLDHEDFRRIALALDGVIESSHMSHPDFRAHGRIFVTLQHDRAWGGLMLTPEQQRRLLADYPGSFKPAAGAWGLGGATLVHIAGVEEEVLGEAITLAWQNAAAKAGARAAASKNSRKTTKQSVVKKATAKKATAKKKTAKKKTTRKR